MKEEKYSFSKLVRPKRALFIVGLILIIVGVALAIIIGKDTYNEDAVYMSDVTLDNIYAKIDVDMVTDYFATSTLDNTIEHYYFVYSGDYIYIAMLTNDNFEKLDEIYEYTYDLEYDGTPPETVTIYGRSEEIPNELLDYALSYLNESGYDYITADNINEYVGFHYLDTSRTQNETFIGAILVGGIFGLIGLILIICYVAYVVKTKNNLKKYETELKSIEEEINTGKAISNKICKVYLTSKYLISYSAGLKILKLEDIVWIYPYEYRQRGVVTQKSIYVILKNGKANIVANISAWGREKQNAYDELYQELISKLPDALHGYSKENKEKAKEMYKK